MRTQDTEEKGGRHETRRTSKHMKNNLNVIPIKINVNLYAIHNAIIVMFDSPVRTNKKHL